MVYVVNMIALPKTVSVTQIKEKDVDSAIEVYLQNSLVCFASIKKYNPDVQLMLCTDYNLPEKYRLKYEKLGAIVEHVDFDLEVMSKSNWSICNYRYCVMHHLCITLNEEDTVLMLDTDIICVDSLQDMFDDLFDDIFLYDVKHRRCNQERNIILANYKTIYGKETNLIHYGGEFIFAKLPELQKLYTSCMSVINASNQYDNLTNFNDEHITSIAVHNDLRAYVHPSEAYISRYWTSNFYLTSTNWKHNPVALWHLPAEKSTGLKRLFLYYEKHQNFPSREKLAKSLGLPSAERKYKTQLLRKIYRKIKK